MIGPYRLFALALKRARALLAATGLLLGAFQVLMVFIASSIKPEAMDQIADLLPPVVQKILGPSVASVMSFSGIACIGYFDLVIVIALLALVTALGTLPASEIETGVADLILARPLPRHWLITRTIALVVFAITLMLALMVAGTWIGLVAFASDIDAWPSAGMVVSLATNLGALIFCWGGIATAFGAACRRSVAGAVTGLLALFTLLLDLVRSIWSPAESVAWLSPFHYFVPFEIVMGRPLPAENLVVLWAIAMTGFTVAYFLFSQRDISR
jgi:ABC-2 type transport system permease protein